MEENDKKTKKNQQNKEIKKNPPQKTKKENQNAKNPNLKTSQKNINLINWKNSLLELLQKPEISHNKFPKLNIESKKTIKIKSLKNQNLPKINKNKKKNSQKIKKKQKPQKNRKKQKILNLTTTKNLDFNSESEKIIDEPQKLLNYKNLVFCKIAEIPNFSNIGDFEVNFVDFIKKRNSEECLIRFFECKFCGKCFRLSTALGGHIGKNHFDLRKKKNLDDEDFDFL